MADHGSVQILGVGSLGINHLFQYSIQCLHPRSFTMEDKVFQKSENMYKLQLNKYISFTNYGNMDSFLVEKIKFKSFLWIP